MIGACIFALIDRNDFLVRLLSCTKYRLSSLDELYESRDGQKAHVVRHAFDEETPLTET